MEEFVDKNPLKLVARDARGLALDAVTAANSGHLGMPLGCAEIGAVLFGDKLRCDPSHPTWINRDRFVLSAGHGSIFLYTWLHLLGYSITLDDIKLFRRTGSITHGHPEFNKMLGIECTTGPLGQGIANAVGIALSCKKMGAIFNTSKHKIIDNNVICLCGDGCLQEGVASEACSLAGHWKLDNLILIFDSNNVTLDAELSRSQTEDIKKRFEAYGFQVFRANGNDLKIFANEFDAARRSKQKCPKVIICDTTIGYGIDEVAGTNKAHGAAGVKFSDTAKKRLGLPDEKFFVSDTTRNFFKKRQQQCQKLYSKWQKKFQKWQKENPVLYLRLTKAQNSEIKWSRFSTVEYDKMSTREAAGKVLQELVARDRDILSGSADLFSSTCNYIKHSKPFSCTNLRGKNIYFGIREHAMAAICNGITYDGFFRIICSTFLVFSDYMRAAMRVAALAKLNVIYVLTHDSIAVGEDGPTHQPVETIASLRCIPNLDIVRPADYDEVVGAWQLAFSNIDRPTALILSRQDLPKIATSFGDRTSRSAVVNGAYIVRKERDVLRVIILASGSELNLAVKCAEKFPYVRVVSMPCMEAFERQSEAYKNFILPNACRCRIAIEAGIGMPWYKYVGIDGKVVSVEKFGFSGQSSDLLKHFNMTTDALEDVLNNFVNNRKI